MLTSFFGNSKTTNYILLALALPLVLALRWWGEITAMPSLSQGLKLVAQSTLLILALLLLDFLIRKNKLTQTNTFGLWWYFCGIVAGVTLGNVIESIILVIALLALRRIMSMANEQNLEKKIFDAALWILVISLFNPWFLWMMLALYMGILQLNQSTWRYYLIPLFSGLCLGLVLAGGVVLSANFNALWILDWPLFTMVFEPLNWIWPQAAWLQLGLLAATLLLLTTLIRLPLAYKEGTTISQGHFQWVWRVLIMVLVIAGLLTQQKPQVFLWLVLPLTAILYANILELRQPNLLREILAFLPLALPMAQLLLK